MKQKRLRGVGCTSARRPGLPQRAACPARARPPRPLSSRTPAARPQHLQRGHPLPAAPPAPPAGGASQVHLERGRHVNSRCAAPSEQQECARTAGQSGSHPPSAEPPARRARAAHSARDAPARGLGQLEAGGRSQGGGRGFHTRTQQFLAFSAPALRSPAATPGLFVYKRITSAPPSLPRLWTRPLALFPPPPAPNLLASQWCDLGIGWSRPSRSSYALPFRGAIKSAARSPHLFAPQSWKCNCWELRRLLSWRRRRPGRSERCDQAAIARFLLSPAASCL